MSPPNTKQPIWTDEQISAFLDGELDEAQTEALAKEVEADEVLAARVERLGAANRAYVAAVSEIDTRPLPGKLQDILATPPAAKVIPFRPKAVGAFLMEHRAIAASLLCAVAIWGAVSTVARGPSDPMAPGPDGTILASSTLSRTLESGASSEVVKISADASVTPRLTFASNDGGYCRQFDLSSPQGTTSAIACREGKGWRTQVVVFSVRRTNPNDFQTAAGSHSPALEAFINQRILGAPLNAQEETRLLSGGWKSLDH